MTIELLVPRPRIIVPKLPSYVKLDMAFGVGAGASLYDKSRYRSHGTITGAAWAAGLHGYCLDFVAATPSYVEIPASVHKLNFTTEDFSIIARIYLDTLTDSGMVFSNGATRTDGWGFMFTATGRLYFRGFFPAANQDTFSSAGVITTGAGFTIGASRVGAVAKVYKNGVDVTSTSFSHSNFITSARSGVIGYWFATSLYPVDGKIEFLRIFGGIALSASAHLAWHNALA